MEKGKDHSSLARKKHRKWRGEVLRAEVKELTDT